MRKRSRKAPFLFEPIRLMIHAICMERVFQHFLEIFLVGSFLLGQDTIIQTYRGFMSNENSELVFFLVDDAGNRRIPFKIRAEHDPYGYALHPKKLGNDTKAARYTEDLKELVQWVVLQGFGVRTKAKKGPQKWQANTLYLGERTVSGYYLSKSRLEWVDGAEIRPLNETAAA